MTKGGVELFAGAAGKQGNLQPAGVSLGVYGTGKYKEANEKANDLMQSLLVWCGKIAKKGSPADE
jgi:hypothetical protein